MQLIVEGEATNFKLHVALHTIGGFNRRLPARLRRSGFRVGRLHAHRAVHEDAKKRLTGERRHRLNPRGNRQLNHAIYVAALTQVGHDTAGRAYYLRKQAEGKSKKEAMRALKRRVSDVVYRQLLADAH